MTPRIGKYPLAYAMGQSLPKYGMGGHACVIAALLTADRPGHRTTPFRYPYVALYRAKPGVGQSISSKCSP